MENKNNVVNQNLTGATPEAGVETTPPKAPEVEVDFLSEYEKVLTENKRLAEERDNYKRIGLNKKKGIPEEPILDEDEVERRAEQRAQEMISDQRLREANQKKDDLILKALKENRELKIAIRNKSGIVGTPTGASSNSTQGAITETFFSADQLAVLKSKGIDPQKVKENYLKANR